MFELLISKGVHINAKNLYYSNRLLVFFVTLISNKKWKIHMENETPLHYLSMNNGSREMIELIILKGADINMKNINNHNFVISLFN